MKNLSTTLLLAILLLASCAQDNTQNIEDLELEQTILESSMRVGKSFYTMPNSDDFRNIPQDVQNRLTNDKVALGKLLFHETAFATAGNFDITKGTFSCASCHHAAAGFQAGVMQGIGDGGMGFGIAGESRIRNEACAEDKVDVQPLRSPSAMNLAYQTNLLWNGQFGATGLNRGTEDQWTEGTPIAVNELGYSGLETQAIAGLGVHRLEMSAESVEIHGYKQLFDDAFGNIDESDRYTAERAGQAIAAYERTLLANEAPFQQWLRGDEMAMTESQKLGANLFFGKAQCATCHSGPALAGMQFHAIGMSDFDPAQVENFKEGDASGMGRGSFTKRDEDMFKFKVPQLYNLVDSPFYGHGSSFTSVREVVEYKNLAVSQKDMDQAYLSDQFVPLNLTASEIDQLVDFLENGLYDPNLFRYVPTELPSGQCFPNSDPTSKEDLGCD